MADEVQVLVRFTTKLPNDLRVPDTEVVRGPAFGDIGCLWQLATAVLLLHRRFADPVATSPHPPQAVPASLKRYGLSQIINHMLSLGA